MRLDAMLGSTARLPHTRRCATLAAMIHALPLGPQERAMHALIIEDESVIAMVIEDILRECGFTSFDFASSPQEALDAAASQSPDLITSDVQLKPGCGIATVQTIRSGLAVPVIFITGNAVDVTRRMPGFPVLSKPFSQAALSTAVAAALG